MTSCGWRVIYASNLSSISLCLSPNSVSNAIALPCRDDSEPSVPVLSLRCLVEPGVDDTGEPGVLPKRRWVDSCNFKSCAIASSHQGQTRLRFSQPENCRREVQFARLVVLVQGRTRWYQRWLQGWVETFKPATHMVACELRGGLRLRLRRESVSFLLGVIEKPEPARGCSPGVKGQLNDSRLAALLYCDLAVIAVCLRAVQYSAKSHHPRRQQARSMRTYIRCSPNRPIDPRHMATFHAWGRTKIANASRHRHPSSTVQHGLLKKQSSPAQSERHRQVRSDRHRYRGRRVDGPMPLASALVSRSGARSLGTTGRDEHPCRSRILPCLRCLKMLQDKHIPKHRCVFVLDCAPRSKHDRLDCGNSPL